ncbi:unnamed protein product [Blepharisma stoltei]|uniref:Uncharacterized protein n=1 Tax=Blepharisma stoltei TaxID=1481888 RepID=A0AAU9JN26_9CILI|nr:unnamed protein product [Blepharisma stoltei]
MDIINLQKLERLRTYNHFQREKDIFNDEIGGSKFYDKFQPFHMPQFSPKQRSSLIKTRLKKSKISKSTNAPHSLSPPKSRFPCITNEAPKSLFVLGLKGQGDYKFSSKSPLPFDPSKEEVAYEDFSKEGKSPSNALKNLQKNQINLQYKKNYFAESFLGIPPEKKLINCVGNYKERLARSTGRRIINLEEKICEEMSNDTNRSSISGSDILLPKINN